jgi:hypothetical protein
MDTDGRASSGKAAVDRWARVPISDRHVEIIN